MGALQQLPGQRETKRVKDRATKRDLEGFLEEAAPELSPEGRWNKDRKDA